MIVLKRVYGGVVTLVLAVALLCSFGATGAAADFQANAAANEGSLAHTFKVTAANFPKEKAAVAKYKSQMRVCDMAWKIRKPKGKNKGFLRLMARYLRQCYRKADHTKRVAMKEALETTTAAWSEQTNQGLIERLNPCVKSYTVGVDYAGALNPTAAASDLQRALTTVGAVTGYRFTLVPANTTGVLLHVRWDATLIHAGAFVKNNSYPTTYPQAAGSYAEIRDSWLTVSPTEDGHENSYRYVLFLHELGHVFGLDHVNDTVDLMSYQGEDQAMEANRLLGAPLGYGPGDLVGLKAHGYRGETALCGPLTHFSD